MISSSELVWNRRDDGRHCGVLVPTIALLLRTPQPRTSKKQDAESARAAAEHQRARNPTTLLLLRTHNQQASSKKQDEESARAAEDFSFGLATFDLLGASKHNARVLAAASFSGRNACRGKRRRAV